MDRRLNEIREQHDNLFRHIMQRPSSLEKALMTRKVEGKRITSDEVDGLSYRGNGAPLENLKDQMRDRSWEKSHDNLSKHIHWEKRCLLLLVIGVLGRTGG